MKEIADKIRTGLDEIKSLLSSEKLLSEKIALANRSDKKVLSWSKTNAFSIIPFYNELTGYKSGKMQNKEPENKKNVYSYLSSDEFIDTVVSYNSKGVIEDTSYIIRDGDEVLEIKQNAKGDYISINQVFLDDQGLPLTAFFANDDDKASGYYYFYKDGKIDKILTVSNYSPLPYVILSCIYGDDNVINQIYFDNNRGRVIIYPR